MNHKLASILILFFLWKNNLEVLCATHTHTRARVLFGLPDLILVLTMPFTV